jgi:hypothetical protein
MRTSTYLTPNDQLRAAREERGLAQYGLAVLAGTSLTTGSRDRAVWSPSAVCGAGAHR